MQALQCKLVVLVQILLIILQKTITAFARIRPQQDSALYPDVGFTLRPIQPPTIFFALPKVVGLYSIYTPKDGHPSQNLSLIHI